ncbi:DUF5134 domain-containing protein [Nocardia vulneris]|uniref:DUF5134 domain-containing protein n=1 Tax=Nocardia vulneris TaxID=1141657 RepID=A0ABR4ZAY4_9NOCA|nr:DUF5134 domain-containing protein [Nocardia vulneris]KIA62511.1 hypothetical protein FG87_24860 [Nocardia vulneris]
MITDPFVRWAVSVGFLATAVFWATRAAARSTTVPVRITGLLHVVMSLAMLAMVWSRLPQVSTVVGMTFFAVAAAVFVVLLVARREHRLEHGYHALMMATMVWMYAVMDSSIVGGTSVTSAEGSMNMGGGVTMSMPATMSMHLPSWAGNLDLAIGLGYLVLAAIWVAHTYRRSTVHDLTHRRLGAMHALMAGATAVMFLSYTG